jgi:hypothetical protein
MAGRSQCLHGRDRHRRRASASLCASQRRRLLFRSSAAAVPATFCSASSGRPGVGIARNCAGEKAVLDRRICDRRAVARRRRRQRAVASAQFLDAIFARPRNGVPGRPVPHRCSRHYRRYFFAAAALSAVPVSAVTAAAMAVAARRRLAAGRAGPLAAVSWNFLKERRRGRINHRPSAIYFAVCLQQKPWTPRPIAVIASDRIGRPPMGHLLWPRPSSG